MSETRPKALYFFKTRWFRRSSTPKQQRRRDAGYKPRPSSKVSSVLRSPPFVTRPWCSESAPEGIFQKQSQYHYWASLIRHEGLPKPNFVFKIAVFPPPLPSLIPRLLMAGRVPDYLNIFPLSFLLFPSVRMFRCIPLFLCRPIHLPRVCLCTCTCLCVYLPVFMRVCTRSCPVNQSISILVFVCWD